jgi:hypothetical protein
MWEKHLGNFSNTVKNNFKILDSDLFEKQLSMMIHNGHVTLKYFKEISLCLAKAMQTAAPFAAAEEKNSHASPRSASMQNEVQKIRQPAKSSKMKKNGAKKDVKMASSKTKEANAREIDPYALGERVSTLQKETAKATLSTKKTDI